MTDYIARICEQWTMPLHKPKEQWFLDWVLRSPKEVSGHLTAGWHAYKSLLDHIDADEVETAREYFGGMGAQTLMIQSLFAHGVRALVGGGRQRFHPPGALVSGGFGVALGH